MELLNLRPGSSGSKTGKLVQADSALTALSFGDDWCRWDGGEVGCAILEGSFGQSVSFPPGGALLRTERIGWAQPITAGQKACLASLFSG